MYPQRLTNSDPQWFRVWCLGTGVFSSVVLCSLPLGIQPDLDAAGAAYLTPGLSLLQLIWVGAAGREMAL